MAELRGGSTIAGYTALHSGLKEAYLTGNLTINGKMNVGGTEFASNGDNSLRMATNSGYIEIGPKNTSYAHIYTDRPSFYFNKDLRVNGSVVWHSGNVGAGSNLDADKVDGLHASSFMRADADDTFSGKHIASARQAGIYGTYSSSLIDHIWSMGSAYTVDAAGANFGSLYGIAYKHTNNTTGGTMAGGHQIVFTSAGTPGAAIGMAGNIWTSGSLTTGRNGIQMTDVSITNSAIGNMFISGTAINVQSDNIYLGITDGGGLSSSLAHFYGGITVTNESTFNNKITINGDLTVAGNVIFNEGMLIVSNLSTSNMDHIWHDDGTNTWHFVSDASARSTGNSSIRVGGMTSSGTIWNNGGISGTGGVDVQGSITTAVNVNAARVIASSANTHFQMKGGGTDYHIEGDSTGFNIVQTGVAKRLEVKNNGDLLAGGLYVSKHWKANQFTAPSSGWYSIAYNSGTRASARFKIYSTESGGHHVVEFIASVAYNRGGSSDITLLNNARYSTTDKIGGVRILTAGTYDDQYLHVYLYSGTTIDTYMYENDWTTGWIGRSTPTTGSIPAGYTVYKLELHDNAKRANVYTSTGAPDSLGLFAGDIWIQY